MAAADVLPPRANNTTSVMRQPFIRAQETCVECDGRVYAMEKLVAGSSVYHKWCFRCAYCNNVLSMNNYAMTSACIPYCKTHYAAIFKRKGNYEEFAVKRIEAENDIRDESGLQSADSSGRLDVSENEDRTSTKRWIQSTSLQPLKPVNRPDDVTSASSAASATSALPVVNVRQTRAICEPLE